MVALDRPLCKGPADLIVIYYSQNKTQDTIYSKKKWNFSFLPPFEVGASRENCQIWVKKLISKPRVERKLWRKLKWRPWTWCLVFATTAPTTVNTTVNSTPTKTTTTSAVTTTTTSTKTTTTAACHGAWFFNWGAWGSRGGDIVKLALCLLCLYTLCLYNLHIVYIVLVQCSSNDIVQLCVTNNSSRSDIVMTEEMWATSSSSPMTMSSSGARAEEGGGHHNHSCGSCTGFPRKMSSEI